MCEMRMVFILDDEATVPVNGDIMPCDESDCDINLSVSARATADGGSSPGAQRRKRLCKLRDSLKCRDSVDVDRSNGDADNLYTDNLPEVIITALSRLICGKKVCNCSQICSVFV